MHLPKIKVIEYKVHTENCPGIYYVIKGTFKWTVKLSEHLLEFYLY